MKEGRIMNKEIKCPVCDYKTKNRWVKHRMLQRYCNCCGWKDKPRIPEKIEIKTGRWVFVDEFCQYNYRLYDKYGHTLSFSRSYPTEEEAIQELMKEINRGKKDADAGPYTGVLWPDRVFVEGKVFQ